VVNLIVISSERDLVDEGHLVNALFENGLELLHLRKPEWTVDKQNRFLRSIDQAFHSRISVHQHYGSVGEFGLNYFHVKDALRSEWFVGMKPSNKVNCSASFHGVSELEREGSRWSYCFLSPVFKSISKKDVRPLIDAHYRPSAEIKAFALGGVHSGNIMDVLGRGFAGAAVCGAIWDNSKNPVEAFKKLDSVCKRSVHSY
jgi:thiamine-phosphate pyrophosphorylase